MVLPVSRILDESRACMVRLYLLTPTIMTDEVTTEEVVVPATEEVKEDAVEEVKEETTETPEAEVAAE